MEPDDDQSTSLDKLEFYLNDPELNFLDQFDVL